MTQQNPHHGSDVRAVASAIGKQIGCDVLHGDSVSGRWFSIVMDAPSGLPAIELPDGILADSQTVNGHSNIFVWSPSLALADGEDCPAVRAAIIRAEGSAV